jgi:transcriptional regulator with XRE-family HTH domain
MAPRRRVNYADDPRKVGQRLRGAREAAGLSQRELAFPACTAAYVSRIEKGERLPSLQLMREFASRLGVGEQYLAFGRDDEPRGLLASAEVRVAIRLGQLDTAGEIANAAVLAAATDSERAAAFSALGEVALHQGDVLAARTALERAVQLDANLEVTDPQTAEVLGKVYARASEYEEAAAVFLRNRNRAAAAGDLITEIRFASLLANAYVDSVNFAAAEEVLADAISKSEPLSDTLTLARMFWSQSRLHALQRDTTNAARSAQRALDLLETSDHRYYFALAHQLLAHIELDRGNGARAVELLEVAAPMIEESGRAFELASLRIEQARALLKTGRREDAASVALEAAGLMAEQSPVDAGRSYALVAEVFVELGEEERAIELFELATTTLASTPNRYLVEVYAKLAELHEKRGDERAMIDALKRGMSVQQQAQRPLVADEA